MINLLYLRPAKKTDVTILFGWAKEERIRKNVFDSRGISMDEYQAWFDQVLEDNNQIQLLMMNDEKPVGQTRLRVEGSIAEIDYSIPIEERNFTLGTEIIRLTIETVRNDYPQIEKLIGRVKPSNIASFLCFTYNGFEETNHQLEYNVKEVKECRQLETRSFSDCLGEERVLLLTNNRNAIELFNWIRQRCDAEIYSERLSSCYLKSLKPDLVISYNYSYLVSPECISAIDNRIINLHISYLPWNRGASPNIWSFIEDTPKGVTIHMLSEGLDEGDIILQEKVEFDSEIETFESTYIKLNAMIVELIKNNWDVFTTGKYMSLRKKQIGGGSYHSVADLKKLKSEIRFDWTESIAVFLERYKQLKGNGKT